MKTVIAFASLDGGRRRAGLLFFCLGVVALASACGRPGDPLTRWEDLSSAESAPWVETRNPDLLSVTRERGPLRVRAGNQERESTRKPWSGWWLPVNSRYLFEGTREKPAPLEKLDRWNQKRGVTSQAADYERRMIYDPNAIAWEGSCDAWAIAALLEPEPLVPLSKDGVEFSVGDQKALLVKSYELAEGKKLYGQVFHGTREGIYDDLYPDQLHRFVETELIEQGRPFVLDKDPGVAVWNTPIWKGQIHVEDDSSDLQVAHVTMTLWGADPWVRSMDEVGTRSIALEYTYDLVGERASDGALQVHYGFWTSTPSGPNSVELHPDFVATVPDRVAQRGSRNPEIDPSAVDLLLKH